MKIESHIAIRSAGSRPNRKYRVCGQLLAALGLIFVVSRLATAGSVLVANDPANRAEQILTRHPYRTASRSAYRETVTPRTAERTSTLVERARALKSAAEEVERAVAEEVQPGEIIGPSTVDFDPAPAMMYNEGPVFQPSPDPTVCAGDGCGVPCCDNCSPCMFWIRGEYLLWWVKGFDTPPLVTSSPVGTDRTEAGVLGLPTTSILFGNEQLVDSDRSGGRILAGYWFDNCQSTGIEASYFRLGTLNDNFRAESPDPAIIARPFFNVEPGFIGNDAEIIAFPNLFAGNISVQASSSLQGAELLLRKNLYRGCGSRVDLLAGWRYAQLDERLSVSDFRRVLNGDSGLPVGTTLAEFDRFNSSNTFNGAEIGMVAEHCCCRWWFETRLKLAIGGNLSRVGINGQTTATTPIPGGGTDVVVTPGGLLALGTNMGTHTSTDVAVIPELGATVGYNLTDNLRATLGYTFLYWSSVRRPGDQIDTQVNLSQVTEDGLVGLARPQYLGVQSDVWAQGLSLGLDYRY